MPIRKWRPKRARPPKRRLSKAHAPAHTTIVPSTSARLVWYTKFSCVVVSELQAVNIASRQSITQRHQRRAQSFPRMRRRVEPLGRHRMIDRAHPERTVARAHQGVRSQHDFCRPRADALPRRPSAPGGRMDAVTCVGIARDQRSICAPFDPHMRRSDKRIVDDDVVVVRATEVHREPVAPVPRRHRPGRSSSSTTIADSLMAAFRSHPGTPW